MKKIIFSPLHRSPGRRAQGMVEFALALPVLLLLVFGVIEFARVFQAWLSVQNGARFGVRYAVTGEYDFSYCNQADTTLGYGAADASDGQIDCRVPPSYGGNFEDIQAELIDWARLPSIHDVANHGALAIQKDFTAVVGQPHFFKVTVCSSRDANEDGIPGDFVFFPSDQRTFTPASCAPTEDAGAPGDRVTVAVDFNHPLILPFISSIWPQVHLVATREGVVERFRTSRVINLPMDISLPTNTIPPPPTPTPVTPTPTPDCSLFVCGGITVGSNAEVDAVILNNSPDDVFAERFDFNWDYAEAYGALLNYTNLRVDWLALNGSIFWGNPSNGSTPNDYDSHTDTSSDYPQSFTGPVPLGANSSAAFKADLDGDWGSAAFQTDMLGSDFGLVVNLDNGCTVSCDPSPRPLPTPDCSLYSISDFSLNSYGNVEATVNNGDQYNANLSRAVFDWGYSEQLMTLLGSPDLNLDWMYFRNTYVWGNGNGGATDTDSPTDTSSDSPNTFSSTSFPKLSSSTFRIDLDYNGEQSGWLSSYGFIPSDFGVHLEFDNGCVIDKPAIPRPIVTPTPDCSLIFPDRVRINGDNFEIRVRNNNVAPAFLTHSIMVWPTSWGMYFNYHQFNGVTYYDIDSTSSPIDVILGTPVQLDGNTSATWLADFNNWPASINSGYFSGDLTFNFPGWGDCPVFADLWITPTPTRTATPVPSATAPVSQTPTRTASPTVQIKPSNTPTRSPTITLTPTERIITPPTPTRTRTPTPIYSPTPTITFNLDG